MWRVYLTQPDGICSTAIHPLPPVSPQPVFSSLSSLWHDLCTLLQLQDQGQPTQEKHTCRWGNKASLSPSCLLQGSASAPWGLVEVRNVGVQAEGRNSLTDGN